MSEQMIKSNIKYYKALQDKYAKLYKDALDKEIQLLIELSKNNIVH